MDDNAEKRAAAFFDPRDFDHILSCQRLEIEPVGGVVIRRNGLGIAVDHDRFDPGVAQAVGRVHAAVIELDSLADSVRPAAENDHLAPVAGIGLALRRRETVPLIARVHVRGQRRELGGAGVDALVDRSQLETPSPRRDSLLIEIRELSEPGVGKAHLLQAQESRAVPRQPFPAHSLLNIHNPADLLEEPRLEPAGGVDFGGREPMPISLGNQQQALGDGFRQRRLDRLLAGALHPLDRDLIEAGQAGLHRAQCLLHRFGKTAADRHCLADRFHRCRQQRLGARKLFEGEPRHLGDDVVDRRLERCRRDPCDFVGQLIERVADRQLGGDLGDRETGRLGGKRRRARYPGVHFDDDEPAVGWVDRELHVRAAGVDADFAQYRNRGIAHQLVFLVGQGQSRRDADRIAGVNSHRIDILDRADDDAVVRAVADHLHLIFLPAENRLLDQHFSRRRSSEPAADDFLEFLGIVGDPTAGAAQGKGWPDDRRKPYCPERLDSFGKRTDKQAPGRNQSDFVHRLPEKLTIFGLDDCRFAGADQLDAVPLEDTRASERHCGVEGRLAAHCRQQRLRPFAGNDLRDHFRGDRLDIGRVGQLRVGHDRRRVRIHQDDPIPLAFQRLARLRAGVIEFAGLPDHDGPSADD